MGQRECYSLNRSNQFGIGLQQLRSSLQGLQ